MTVKKTAQTGPTNMQGQEKAADLANKREPTGKDLEQKTGDAAITAEVKAKLDKDDQLRDSSISVDTKDGVVILNGRVANASQERRATDLAHGVNKVSSVHSNLKIEPKQEQSEQQQHHQ